MDPQSDPITAKMSEYLSTKLKLATDYREQRYRDHPEGEFKKGGPHVELSLTVRSIGGLDEHVKTGSGHEFIISEPISVGGRDIAPWPLEYLLGGALGCYAAVFGFYAAKLGVSYEEFEVNARTMLDVRGHMIPGSPSSAFQKVILEINVVSDEPIERLKEVEQLALDGCPGIATLRDPVPVESELSVIPTQPEERAAAE